METKITVITADIIDSKKNPFSKSELENCLQGIEDSRVISPFSVSRGDEIQCVVEGWLKAPELIRHLRYYCRPLALRVGTGLAIQEGELNRDPWAMNGPAFHRAREALQAIYEKESKRAKKALTVVKTPVNEFDGLLNSIWLLMDTIQAGWTGKQWKAVHAYESSGSFQKAAEELGITYQGVFKRCSSANWNQIKEAEATMKRVVQNYLETYHTPQVYGKNMDR